MKILAVCGMGIGSSMMLKININSVLKELNAQDVEVEHCDITSANSTNADLIVVTKDLAAIFDQKRPTLSLSNVMNKTELREKLPQFLNQYNKHSS